MSDSGVFGLRFPNHSWLLQFKGRLDMAAAWAQQTAKMTVEPDELLHVDRMNMSMPVLRDEHVNKLMSMQSMEMCMCTWMNMYVHVDEHFLCKGDEHVYKHENSMFSLYMLTYIQLIQLCSP